MGFVMKAVAPVSNTTPLYSFTDGLILLVTGMNSGKIITDGFIDETRPSV
jgi:hypothetical protein